MTGSPTGKISKNDLIEVNPADLRVKSQVPFDCFIYLTKNDKVVHWIRAGAIFTADHKSKIERMDGAKVMIFRFQKDQFLEYSNPGGQKPKSVNEQLGTVTQVQKSDAASTQAFGETFVAAQNPDTQTGSVQAAAPGSAESYGATQVAEENSTINVRGGNSMVFGKIVRKVAQVETTATANRPQAAAAKSSASSGAQPRLKVDAGFLNIIIMSTQTAFKEVCGIETQFHAPTKRNVQGKSPIKFDVASLISLSSMTIRGAIALCFPEKTFKGIMEHTAGIRADEAEGDLFLGSGELINFIYEIALPQMIDQGYQIQQAVPLFFHGNDLPLSQIMPYPGFSIVFSSQFGPFVFDIGIKTGG